MTNTVPSYVYKLAESCDFETITPYEILRDKLVFGIRDVKTRERVLPDSPLTLDQTDEICNAADHDVAIENS